MTQHRSRRAALLAVIAFMALQMLLGAGTANAQMFSCAEPPTPEYPGDGFVGRLDTPNIDKGEPGTSYNQYAYAGQVWHTYDTGCLGSPSAAMDTEMGNNAFNLGKFVVAVTNGAHWLQQDNGALRPIDDLVAQLTAQLYDNVFVAWIGVTLSAAAIAILWSTLRGKLAVVGKRTAYIFAALGFAAMTYLTPLTYTTIADGLLSDGVSELQSRLLGEDGGAYNALPEALHHNVVYQPWLQGEFGSATSPEAKLGRDLLDAQACSKEETLRAQNGGQPCPVDAKNAKFKEVAEKLKPTPAYDHFTGESSNRVGAGFSSFIASLCYGSFQAMSLLAIFLAKLIIRLIILFGPVIGVIAVIYNSLLERVFKAAGTAVAYGLSMTAIGTIHLVVLRWILDPARANILGDLGKLLLAGLITAALWMMVKPHRKFRSMLESSLRIGGMETMPWDQVMQRRYLRRFRRQQAQHMRAEEREHQRIYNTLNVVGGFGGGHGHDDDRVYATADRPMRASSHRIDAHTGLSASSPGSLSASSERLDDVGGFGSSGMDGGAGPRRPGPAPEDEPGDGGAGTYFDADGGSWVAHPGDTRTALPAAPDNVDVPDGTDRADQSDTGPGASEPQAEAPRPRRVVRPSEYWRADESGTDSNAAWREDERREQQRGPDDPAPSHSEGGRRVYRVYRASSGRVEDDKPKPGSGFRPENQE